MLSCIKSSTVSNDYFMNIRCNIYYKGSTTCHVHFLEASEVFQWVIFSQLLRLFLLFISLQKSCATAEADVLALSEEAPRQTKTIHTSTNKQSGRLFLPSFFYFFCFFTCQGLPCLLDIHLDAERCPSPAEGARLEIVCTSKTGTESSNLSLSASQKLP